MSITEIRQSGAEKMTDAEIDQFLAEQGVGVIAIPTGELPYVIPLSFGYDGESRLYFTYLLFGVESKKEDMSDRADRARFLVHAAPSIYEWRSVLLTGTLAEVADEQWGQLQSAMENAWHPELFTSATPMRGIKGYEFRITDRTSIKHMTDIAG